MLSSAQDLAQKALKLVLTPLLSFGLLAVIVSSPFGSAQTAQAQVGDILVEEITVAAIPPRLGEDGTLSLAPGEKTQVSIQVRNISDRQLEIVSTVHDFLMAEDGFTPIPIDENEGVSTRWSLAEWVILAPNYQLLAPNEIGNINLLIEVPADALPGGHYAMVAHQPQAPGTAILNADGSADTTATASRISQRVGTLVYLTVEGDINELAFIRDLNFPTFSEYGPVPFDFMVDNQSDIHIRPQIAVDIFNIFGTKVDTMTLDTKNVFPLTARQFEGRWDRIWGIGLYRAEVTMSFGTGGQIAKASTSFWLLPITIIIGILLALLSVIAAIIATRRHLLARGSEGDKARIAELERQLRESGQAELNSDQPEPNDPNNPTG